MNETLRILDDRCVLQIERRLAHSPEKVWRAIIEPEHLNQWYPFPATKVDVRLGGTISFDLAGEPKLPGQSTMEGTITECDPPRVFAFSTPTGDVLENEGDNLNRFELHPELDGCRLIFTHAFYDRPFAAGYASGWTDCLNALEMVLDERPVEWPESMVEAYEAFVARFGLTKGSAEDMTDGWRVRFDRQLMQASATTPAEHPVEKVWAVLSGSEPGVPLEDLTAPVVGDLPPAGFTAEQVPPGVVTAVEMPTVLEYDWQFEGRPAGRVRWELSTTPAGTRITLTQTGPPELAEERTTALVAWEKHIEEFVRNIYARTHTMLGTLRTRDDGRFALRFERRFAHPMEKVWRAITEVDHLRAWFPAIVEIDLTPGAKLRFDLAPEAKARFNIADEDMTSYGEVTAVDPPRLLEYTWTGEVMRWELDPDDGGCRLVFTHVFDDREMAAPVGAGWHAGFEGVEAVLDGRPIQRSALYDRADQLGDQYTRSLG